MTDDDVVRRLELVRAPGETSSASTDATARPQDVGRRHRRKGSPSPETAELLTRYRVAMRGELRAVLGELAIDAPPEPGLLEPNPPKRPGLDVRIRLWDLGIKLGRELGTEIDPGPTPTSSATVGPARPRRGRGRVDYGGR